MYKVKNGLTQGDTKHECLLKVKETVSLLTKLGFLIHPVKSVLIPVQVISFLGFILDSVQMLVRPTSDKELKLRPVAAFEWLFLTLCCDWLE